MTIDTLYNLSGQATHEAVHLVCQMLVFDPVSLFKMILTYITICLIIFSNLPNIAIFFKLLFSIVGETFFLIPNFIFVWKRKN